MLRGAAHLIARSRSPHVPSLPFLPSFLLPKRGGGIMPFAFPSSAIRSSDGQSSRNITHTQSHRLTLVSSYFHSQRAAASKCREKSCGPSMDLIRACGIMEEWMVVKLKQKTSLHFVPPFPPTGYLNRRKMSQAEAILSTKRADAMFGRRDATGGSASGEKYENVDFEQELEQQKVAFEGEAAEYQRMLEIARKANQRTVNELVRKIINAVDDPLDDAPENVEAIIDYCLGPQHTWFSGSAEAREFRSLVRESVDADWKTFKKRFPSTSYGEATQKLPPRYFSPPLAITQLEALNRANPSATRPGVGVVRAKLQYHDNFGHLCSMIREIPFTSGASVAVSDVVTRIHTVLNITTVSPMEYMFKVVGRLDFIYGGESFINFRYIRECVMKQMEVKLYVMRLPFDSAVLTQTRFSPQYTAVQRSTVSHEAATVSNVCTSWAASEVCGKLTTAGAGSNSGSAGGGGFSTLSLWELPHPFTIGVAELHNLFLPPEKWRAENIREDDDIFLCVFAEIVFGGKPICPPKRTCWRRCDGLSAMEGFFAGSHADKDHDHHGAEVSLMANPTGNLPTSSVTWFHDAQEVVFDIELSQLPREARLCFTVVGVSGENLPRVQNVSAAQLLEGTAGTSERNILDFVNRLNPLANMFGKGGSGASGDAGGGVWGGGGCGGGSGGGGGGDGAGGSGGDGASGGSAGGAGGGASGATGSSGGGNSQARPVVFNLANVNLQIFDHVGALRMGIVNLRMWPGDARANPIAISSSNPDPFAIGMRLKFPSFSFPVVHPWGSPTSEAIRQMEISHQDKMMLLDLQLRGNKIAQLRQIKRVLSMNTLHDVSDTDRTLLWHYRQELIRRPKALSKILLAVDWTNVAAVHEIHTMMAKWAPLQPLDALELLDARYADSRVRQHAVNALDTMTDLELRSVVLQLIQVLKYEPYHYSALARFLLRRALASPTLIGHVVYWHLASEMHNPAIAERHGLLIEEFLRRLSGRRDILRQHHVVQLLLSVALSIKESKKGDRLSDLREGLDKITFPPSFTLALNPTMECTGLAVSKCKVMDSKKLPLWLVFKNADPLGSNIYVIFKAGDDLRQDLLTLQMLELMDTVWKNSGLDLHLSPYGCVSTGEGVGMIEVVLQSDTVANITRKDGGPSAAFSEEPLMNWLRKFNRTPVDVEKCLWNFVYSTAGYCVATYILGIGDRHNDNIMIREDGTLFHIDFGHFLGNFKTKFGFKRETAPFIFTPMYAYMMGGSQSAIYEHFCEVACHAYNVIRRQSNLLITLFVLMLSTGIPELQTPGDVVWLETVLMAEAADDVASKRYRQLIAEALANKRTLINDYIHIVAH